VRRYVTRRLLLFIPTLLVASLIVFGIMHVLPGDVALVILASEEGGFREEEAEILRKDLGLDRSLPVQYGSWIWSLASGGFGGTSLESREPIREIVARRFPVTVQLALLTLAITLVVSLPLGVIAALQQDKPLDYLIRSVSILGLAMPNFWVALLVILGMVLIFSWVPPVIYRDLWEDPVRNLELMIWPALVVAWGFSSYLIRVTRATMLEVLRQDYIRTAFSKGLTPNTVVVRHALRNTLIPVVTLMGGHLDALLAGSVILENVFGVPGVGQGIVGAATGRDYPVIMSLAMLLVFFALFINLIIDLSYAFIDPRISYD
jgi:peptide/nickel transport system permease protein